MLPKSKLVFIVCSILVVLSSCYQEMFEPIPTSTTWKPNFALPLLTKSYTISKSMVLVGVPEINLDVEGIPEWAKYVNLTLTDTTSLVLSDIINEAEQIRFIEFKLILENEFPSDGEIQIFFLDDYRNTLDVLFNENPLIIVTSSFSTDGVILSKGKSNSTIMLNQERIEKISQAKYVVPTCRIKNDGVAVDMFQYYSGYTVTFSLSARIGVNIPI